MALGIPALELGEFALYGGDLLIEFLFGGELEKAESRAFLGQGIKFILQGFGVKGGELAGCSAMASSSLESVV